MTGEGSKVKTKKKWLQRIKNLDATPFQKRVWTALLEIPRGEVRSYAWLAKKIGRPGACRAVGNALAKNPFAPGVPCHRVVASSGIGGYTGGLAKKRRLLKKEGVHSPPPKCPAVLRRG
ncbi:MAG: MGMT family protein [Deltaproteobacteria bacterium]|nr:MGMT family protein [Deltaproteobacteria bacterium]MBI4374102.1 MGMT family protein [Deltaproteobacteria bacterium]